MHIYICLSKNIIIHNPTRIRNIIQLKSKRLELKQNGIYFVYYKRISIRPELGCVGGGLNAIRFCGDDGCGDFDCAGLLLGTDLFALIYACH